jgi:hypothetical protein
MEYHGQRAQLTGKNVGQTKGEMRMRLVWFTSSVIAVSLVLIACGCRGPGVDYAADWSQVRIPEGTLVLASQGQSLGGADYKNSCRVVDEWWGLGYDNEVGEDVVFEGMLVGAGEYWYAMASDYQSGWPQGLTAFSVGLKKADQGLGYESGVIVIWPGDLPASMPSWQPGDSPTNMHVKVWGVCQTSIPRDSDLEFSCVLARYVTCYAD